MATRIFVQCKTLEMPGLPDQKISLMANAACQKVWNRNFDDNLAGDRLTTFGGYINPKCFLLIDCGPVNATEYTTIQLRWERQELVKETGPLHPYIQKEFKTKYHFNPADRPTVISYTDEELKERVSSEVYNNYTQAIQEQIARAERNGQIAQAERNKQI